MTKNLIFFATLLIIFMLNISDNVISAEAQDEEADPVLDLDGNKLQTGTSYYFIPSFRPGGGVTIYPTADKNCTNGVAQLVFGVGLPVTFAYGETDPDVVRVSTNLTISFSPGILYSPAVWKVDEYDPAGEKNLITSGEIDSNEASINRWFQIRKDLFPGYYKFVFCPKFCESCTQICTDVGISIYDEIRRFVVEGTLSSTFAFKKFEAGTNSTNGYLVA
ncbi:miraculin-like [Primulina huaijiensis]|uniref:miraculin-like n=1 Tax=Primulina huaijiensis TaxID=1492673 RepID=UPI003CC6E6CD